MNQRITNLCLKLYQERLHGAVGGAGAESRQLPQHPDGRRAGTELLVDCHRRHAGLQPARHHPRAQGTRAQEQRRQESGSLCSSKSLNPVHLN